jgi:hypothetical protein
MLIGVLRTPFIGLTQIAANSWLSPRQHTAHVTQPMFIGLTDPDRDTTKIPFTHTRVEGINGSDTPRCCQELCQIVTPFNGSPKTLMKSEATAGIEPAIGVLQTPALATWLRRRGAASEPPHDLGRRPKFTGPTGLAAQMHTAPS